MRRKGDFMKKLLMVIVLGYSVMGFGAHLSLGYFSHPFKEDSRTLSIGAKHFFYVDKATDKEVGADLGGVGIMTGKSGSIMGVISPMNISPNPYYSIGVDLYTPIINKGEYDKILLGVGINFPL